jgi:hypothetical protein
MRDLPSALTDREALGEGLAGRRPAVFLDYDGTLTPIVDRSQDAVIAESMREAVPRRTFDERLHARVRRLHPRGRGAARGADLHGLPVTVVTALASRAPR